MDDGLTVRELVRQTADALGSAHEARWVCEVATSLDGAEFDDAMDDPVTVKMVAHCDAMVARARAGEPLAYVLGRWSFRHIDLAVDRRVLIPRPETEVVAGAAIELAAAVDGPRMIADLGTGSGAIGLSAATELPVRGTTVWLTDVREDALAVARANLAGIGRAAANVRIGIGSWFEALPNDQCFDVIVSNPPYVAVGSPELDESVRIWEPEVALFAGHDGLGAIRALIAGAPAHLCTGGWLVLEIGADQGRAVAAMFHDAGYVDVEIRHDLTGHDRIAIGRVTSG
ncbi:peptide chain release factor N(5)-glutamine methyltransferase [Ilumatobacter sp.]|uniref:peptide chain release factor N(5)-glutamine methyltransferase n=1 Tax=Ilumatobacter sp. TaxID=1967498 RepID=UPI003AF81836